MLLVVAALFGMCVAGGLWAAGIGSDIGPDVPPMAVRSPVVAASANSLPVQLRELTPGAFDSLSGRATASESAAAGETPIRRGEAATRPAPPRRASVQKNARKVVVASAEPGTEPAVPGLGKRVVASVVRARRASVARACWQPALARRSFDAPPMVRVTLEVRVEPSGAVGSAQAMNSASGYPGLSACLEKAVKSWSFPTAPGATRTRVPFVFTDG
jgi:hypothetical protein